MKHADPARRQAWLPSLLDRLQDDAPQSHHERSDAYAPNREGMYEIVKRDLALLLNSANLASEFDGKRYPLVAASVINYGIPPQSGNWLGDQHRETVGRHIHAAILQFEPRLIPESVRVRHLGKAVSPGKLMFEIGGLMHWSPYPLEFRLQSTFDFETQHVTLDPASSGRN